jgi:hypothetical protein
LRLVLAKTKQRGGAPSTIFIDLLKELKLLPAPSVFAPQSHQTNFLRSGVLIPAVNADSGLQFVAACGLVGGCQRYKLAASEFIITSDLKIEGTTIISL